MQIISFDDVLQVVRIHQLNIKTGSYISINVGTGSAYADVFTKSGELLATAHNKIQIYRNRSDIALQNSPMMTFGVLLYSRSYSTGLGCKRWGWWSRINVACSLVPLGEQAHPLRVSYLVKIRATLLFRWTIERRSKQITSTRHPIVC